MQNVGIFFLFAASACFAASTAQEEQLIPSVESHSAPTHDNCVGCSPISSASNNKSSDSVSENNELIFPSCGLYVAPSTVPNAGLGIFTAIDRSRHETIGIADPAIPIHGLVETILDEYAYPGFYLKYYEDETRSILLGSNSLVNSNPGLVNVHFTNPIETRDFGPDHPNHHTIATTRVGVEATHDIPAHSELFVSYGDWWFQQRVDRYGRLPLTHDYVRAEHMTRKWYAELLLPDILIKKDLWDLIKSLPWKTRSSAAIPENFPDAIQVARHGIRSFHQTLATSNDYSEHGRCLDLMNIRPSTIPGAGLGAFAAVPLVANSVISGSPVLHLVDGWDDLSIQPWNSFTQSYEDDESHHQLLMNYCWSHPHSTVLLCPYGSGIHYINHDKQRANVKVQWAPHGVLGQNSMALNVSLSYLELHPEPILALDFVAIRDIAAGEELFLDYGDDWKAAWKSHEHSFQPLPVQSAEEWNTDAPMILRTEEEQEYIPYPPNIEFRCHPDIITDYHNDRDPDWDTGVLGLPCQILDRSISHGLIVYKVRMFVDGAWEQHFDVPRIYIRFADRPHSHTGFRHPMYLSGDIFPNQWRNLDWYN